MGPRYVAPRYAPTRFFRPYYVFRPRARLSFGLWVGVPFAYYDPFYDPYPYEYPYAPETGSVDVQPGPRDMGGLSFEITPSDAQVFVDGASVGTVGQFTANSQPLGLVAGRHHVEVRAPGYQTMAFDVDIVAGQVIPYQGAMQP